MADNLWKEIQRTLPVIGDRRSSFVEESDCAAIEKVVGHTLPKSFRDFVLLFGPVYLSGDIFRIAAPRADPVEADSFNSLLILNELYHARDAEIPEYIRPPDDPDQFRRIVFFGDWLPGGIAFGWDPKDLTTANGPEYGVWAWDTSSSYHLDRIAESFADFVLSLLDEVKYADMIANCTLPVTFHTPSIEYVG